MLRHDKRIFVGKAATAAALLAVSLSGLHLLAQKTAAAEKALPGAPIFAASCAGCHGADGRGGEHAPNIATAAEVQRLADHDLAGIIHNGIAGAGMPAFPGFKPQEQDAVIAYLRSLQGRNQSSHLPGDADRGQTLYFGKAQCFACHMVNGQGGFYGNDLSFYGATASAEQMHTLLIDPAKNLAAENKETVVVTNTGQTLTGMLKTSSNFSVALQTSDGQFHFLNRSELSKIEVGVHSPMQSVTGLSDQEMNDLLSYLLRTGDENASRLPPHAEKADDDDN